jgi:kynureninase
MERLELIQQSPNALSRHYSHFHVRDRILLTGHSHQAWPDVAREAQLEAWDDAAAAVDDKWTHAFKKADRVREGFAQLLHTSPDEIALGANTHELVTRFLSALPLNSRPRLLTTDGEFHTIRRQLDRLGESGLVEVVKVAGRPVDSLVERLIEALDWRAAAVLVSSVLFATAEMVPGLDRLAAACQRHGAELLVDVYHHLNVIPWWFGGGLEDAFIVGGGYKYCQLGEGNCFLRVPPGRGHYRPLLTGWFSEFSDLSRRTGGEVAYGEGPARWAGSTYDPVSHYRGARVFEFFVEHDLTPLFLCQVSLHQVGLLASEFDALDLNPELVTRDRDRPADSLTGFLALRTRQAESFTRMLRARHVWTDFRDDVLRLGPAPYLSDAQLEDAIRALGEVARAMIR